MLTFCYLAAFNWWLVLCPSTLSHDWQMGSIPLLTSISDPRNLLTLWAFASTVLMLHRSLLDFEVCILSSVFQFKNRSKPNRTVGCQCRNYSCLHHHCRRYHHRHHHNHYHQANTLSRFLLNCDAIYCSFYHISIYLWFSFYSLSLSSFSLALYMVFLCYFFWLPPTHPPTLLLLHCAVAGSVCVRFAFFLCVAVDVVLNTSAEIHFAESTIFATHSRCATTHFTILAGHQFVCYRWIRCCRTCSVHTQV